MSSRDDSEGRPTPHAHPDRQFPRIQLALTVRLRFQSVDQVLESNTVDISEGGVFIRMEAPRAEGTVIRLRLDIGAETLEIGGVVVRCVRPGEGEPPGIGVLFTDIRPEDRVRVQALIYSSLEPRRH